VLAYYTIIFNDSSAAGTDMVCKSTDSISLQLISLHFRQNGPFIVMRNIDIMRTIEVRTIEVRTITVRTFEVRTIKVRTIEVRTIEVRTIEVRT
jgi:hypothetical protein